MTNKFFSFFSQRDILPFLLFVVYFLLYLHHLSPSVYGGDVGDMVSAIAVSGVPHPSGYPLFTMLGIVLNSFFSFSTPAWRVGLISVIASAFSVVLMYLIIKEITKDKVLAFIGALTLAFIYPFWHYAEVAEVFALAYFFVLLLFYFAILYHMRKEKKYLYLQAFFAGLSLSHHEFLILIFPSLVFLALYTNWRILFMPKLMISLLSLFILGLTPYIYIPIAASTNPSINWDNATTLDNFLHLVLRQSYGWSGDTTLSFSGRLFHLASYFTYLRQEVYLTTIVSSIFGLLYLLRSKRYSLAVSLSFAFFFTGPFFVLYAASKNIDVFVLQVYERFYTFSIIFIVMLFSLGVKMIIEALSAFFRRKKLTVFLKRYSFLFLILFFLVPFLLFLRNLEKNDLSNVWVGDHLGKDILTVLPKNSVLLTSGDTSTFNLMYQVYALGFRKDVVIKDHDEYLRNNRSYREKIKEVKKKFKGIGDTDARMIALYELPQIPFFSANYLSYAKPKKEYPSLIWIPYGLVWKLLPSGQTDLSKEEFIKLQREIWKKLHADEITSLSQSAAYSFTMIDIQHYYARSAAQVGEIFLNGFGDKDNAIPYFEMAVAFSPYLDDVHDLLARHYASIGKCSDAEKIILRALRANPQIKYLYGSLYVIYLSCYSDKQRASEIEREYQKQFNENLSIPKG